MDYTILAQSIAASVISAALTAYFVTREMRKWDLRETYIFTQTTSALRALDLALNDLLRVLLNPYTVQMEDGRPFYCARPAIPTSSAIFDFKRVSEGIETFQETVRGISMHFVKDSVGNNVYSYLIQLADFEGNLWNPEIAKDDILVGREFEKIKASTSQLLDFIHGDLDKSRPKSLNF